MFSQMNKFFRCAAAISVMVIAGCSGGSSTSSVAPVTPAPPNTTPLGVNVTLASGAIAGNPADANGIFSYKGIPYAAPPVNGLRWKEPQPVANWTGVLTTTTFSNACWASSGFPIPVPTAGVSEDCLYLNVWSGAKTLGAKLPVMVSIHGGGFEFLTASSPFYDGTNLATNGVIVVSMNYRLGVFGFLSRPDLDAESNGHKSGMYGMLDMVAALQWVKSNIAAFGGDPTNVTVFGESAGAHAIGLLAASPLAAGLFQKAIGESGAFWSSEHGDMKAYADAQMMGLGLGAQVGAPTLAQLRAVPPLALQTATNWTLATDPGYTGFSPIVDGYFMPQDPFVQYMTGKQNDVALLVGWNTDEGLLFDGRALPTDTLADYTNAASQEFGAANLPAFLQVYPGATLAQAAQSAQSLVGDQIIKYQTWGWATQQVKTGHSPVYLYNFSYTSPFNPNATHYTDEQFVLGNLTPSPLNPVLAAPPGPADVAMSKTMQSYWTNFAKNGSPNGTGLPVWPQYTGAGGMAMQLGNVVQPGPEEGTARYQFLDKFRINGLITVTQSPL